MVRWGLGGVVEAHFSVQLKRKTAEQNSAQRTAHNKYAMECVQAEGSSLFLGPPFLL